METAKPKVEELLRRLEEYYGPQRHAGPIEPYQMIVYANCGYPANDANCSKGYEALKREVGTQPEKLLAAPKGKLTTLLRPSAIVPKIGAARLKDIARMAKKEFGGNLRAVLKKFVEQETEASGKGIRRAKIALKKFPVIGEPGAEKILLFAGMAPVAAVPSAFVHVPSRIWFGEENKNYGAGYRAAQNIIARELPETLGARQRAYLLLKRHGQGVCKRSKPKCDICPVSGLCAFFQTMRKGTLG
jgi:endonuclease III